MFLYVLFSSTCAIIDNDYHHQCTIELIYLLGDMKSDFQSILNNIEKALLLTSSSINDGNNDNSMSLGIVILNARL